MNLNPAELPNPIFNVLDSLIENDGVCLHLVFVWLALLAIAWMRKRMKGNSTAVIPAIVFTMQPPMQRERWKWSAQSVPVAADTITKACQIPDDFRAIFSLYPETSAPPYYRRKRGQPQSNAMANHAKLSDDKLCGIAKTDIRPLVSRRNSAP